MKAHYEVQPNWAETVNGTLTAMPREVAWITPESPSERKLLEKVAACIKIAESHSGQNVIRSGFTNDDSLIIYCYI